ncbi:putative endopeptidase p60 precursor [Pelotomaculum schinkii]|uniref:Putative endopeptidase p60 n=1 Tax=Pelotomaculum schinkii TaxID=78350 RepID=A0A4Y7RAC5_9FIRM|nr:C40 family peptidase [Pelotomaculum schinkii]TEB05611.1 putative endopeptidase p60 precursor [Pelotomaculum schinkii]
MRDGNRRPEHGPSSRLRFEDNPGTSGQVGPKSTPRPKKKKQPQKIHSQKEPSFSQEEAKKAVSPDTADIPDASPTSGHVDPKSPNSKYRQYSEQSRPSDRLRSDDTPPHRDGSGSEEKASGSSGKKAARDAEKLNQSKFRAERSGEKLNASREKLAAQKPPKKPGPVKTAGRAARFQAWRYVHGKIHEVERENVGTEAAHRTELAGETAVRGTTRFIKHRVRTHPARQVRKWERRDIRAKADFQYRTMVQEHPELKSNPVSRFWQKRRLKKQYAKQAREAAKHGKQAVKFTEKIARTVTAFVKRNPKILLIGLVLFLLIIILQSCVASLATIGNGLIGAIGGTSYVSSDSDIEAVEASYTGLEKDLREKLSRIESDYPGYDEYRYSVDEIGHDPFELASYLTAKFGEYTPEKVQAELQSLFRQQYSLTVTRTVEVRYRTETRTDTWTDENGNTHHDTYTVEVPYNYYILNVSLKNKSLGTVAAANLDTEQQARYAVYQKTQGNRPKLFEGNIYAHPGEYTDYDVPPEALADPDFAALIGEAEKYLGYPYVWGGSSPSTSFDCSGFVCYVLDKSGVYPMSRTTAQGIFNQCAKIRPAEAKPGDIIFFTGTYDSSGAVSHVGIYVGDNMMLHCASGGVQYARMDTKYWTEHFYAFGRLSG